MDGSGVSGGCGREETRSVRRGTRSSIRSGKIIGEKGEVYG